jgi:hypothetical protein
VKTKKRKPVRLETLEAGRGWECPRIGATGTVVRVGLMGVVVNAVLKAEREGAPPQKVYGEVWAGGTEVYPT